MIKKYRILLLLVLSFLQTVLSKGQDSLSVLLKNSVEIKSIDPTNEKFDDLVPLIEKIGNAKVVVLGEISHSDGASLACKARLVKFLHEKMGFGVLAWEAGELDCQNLNTALRSNLPIAEAKQRLMKGGWDNEEPVQPVFEYARASWNTGSPLEMMGFDGNRPPYGSKGFLELMEKIYQVFPFLMPDLQTKLSIESLTRINYGFFPSKKLDSLLSSEKRESALSALRSILAGLQKNDPVILSRTSKAEVAYDCFMIEMALLRWKEMEAFSNNDHAGWNRLRDSLMDVSLQWQMAHLYPDKKVIIWAATAHFIRNSNDVRNINSPTNNNEHYKQAGDYLYDRMGGSVYTIACTAFSGTIGYQYHEFDDRGMKDGNSSDTIRTPEKGSYEDWAHRSKKDFLFTDLKAADKNDWLQKEFVANCLGFNPDKATWHRVIDAFIFIDKMFPVRKIAKGK